MYGRNAYGSRPYGALPSVTSAPAVPIGLFGFGSGASSSYLYVYMLPGGALRVYDQLSAADVIVGTTIPTAGVSHHVALTRSGGTTRLFLDGVQEGSNWSDTKNYVNSSTEPEIGSYLGQPLTGWMDEVRIIVGSAAWTANFTPPASAYVGTTAKVLSAATGTFALAGQIATPRYGHVAVAVKGAFTLTGQANALRYGHKMQAGTGAIALAGQSVTLRTARKLSVATGPLAVTGIDVTLTKTTIGVNYTMQALPGAVTLAAGLISAPSGATVHIDFLNGPTGYVSGVGAVGIGTLLGNDPNFADSEYSPVGIGPYGYDWYNSGTLTSSPCAIGALRTAIVRGDSTVIKMQTGLFGFDEWVEVNFFPVGQGYTLQVYNTGAPQNALVFDALEAGVFLDAVWQPYTGPNQINVLGFNFLPSNRLDLAAANIDAGTVAITNASTPPANPVSIIDIRAYGPIASITTYLTLSLADLKAKTARQLEAPVRGAILRYGRKLVTTAGTFTLNGVAPGLRYGHVLSAAPRAVVLAGQPIILSYGSSKTMTASTGTVTLAGPVTKLAFRRIFPTTAGAVTLAGQTTTLRYARVVPAVKGTLTLNGVATGLRLAHVMSVTEGTVTLSGKPVTLGYTRLMPAVKGTLVVNGSATNLIWSGAGAKTMPAAVGAFVLSGKVVTFKRTAVIKATVTTYTLTGSDTRITVGKRLTAVPGVFTLSGKAAGLSRRRGMSAEPGAIILTGKPANLLRLIINRYFIPAQVGSIQLTGGWNTQLSWSGTVQPGPMNIGRKAHLWRW